MNVLQRLLDRHVTLFNDPDGDRRRGALGEVYADDLLFIDPHKRVRGLEAYNDLVDALHVKFPGFVLRPLGPVDEHNGVGRFRWSLERREGGPVHGTDFLKLEGDRLGEVVVFFD